MNPNNRSRPSDWPELPWGAWAETAAGLHLRTQVVGKIRMVRSPWTNHSWHVPLYLTARGLGTSPIPHGGRTFEIDFDLVDHVVRMRTGEGEIREVALGPGSIAAFHRDVVRALEDLGLPVEIHTTPSEIPDAVPFERDTVERPYDADAVDRFRRALLQADRVFKEFRAGFVGKCSPVHFFWGSFDLAVTRFSGRKAPAHPGGVPNFPDWVAREAYSHEVSSVGFWPGGGGIDHPSFYAYAYPAPDGFAQAKVRPEAASWFEPLGEFVLPYDAVRTSSSPDDTLLAFLESTYAAAADLAGWDRASLEGTFGPDA